MEDPGEPAEIPGIAEEDGVAEIEDQQAGQVIGEKAGVDPCQAFDVRYSFLFHRIVEKENEGEKREYDDEDGFDGQSVRVESEDILDKERINEGECEEQQDRSMHDPGADKITQHSLIEQQQAG